MSASPMARQATGHHTIPVTRRVVINHEHEMPSDYGTTPGGTMFGYTPGGTKIVYERGFLLSMRNSPLANSPPPNLPVIPGVTKTSTSPPAKDKEQDEKNSSNIDCPSKLQTVKEESPKEDDNHHQFHMDM